MDTRSFRRTLAGTCLILGPAVLVVAEILHPRQDDDAATALANIAGSTTSQYWAHALALIATTLAIPAVLGIVHLTRGRAVLTHLGGALAIVGLIAIAALVGTEFVLWQAAKNPDTAAMTVLLDQLLESSGLVPLYIVTLAYPVGFLLLGIALQLTRTAPTWAAASLAIAPAVLFANVIAIGPKWLTVAATTLILLASGTIGSRLLTESDDEWEALPAAAS